ncbi:MAG: hypothetical protein M1818_004512 [Claussenomyces sp. TS43310]|nr:MAG: hypothetical protein M1818_004512 [Claussenomyces sp. TS43310]
MSPSDTRFFTEDWIITLESHPHLRFAHVSPAYIEDHIKVVTSPLSNSFTSGQHKVWNEEELDELRQRLRQRYMDAKSKHHALNLLVQVDGEFAGRGGVYEIEPGFANIGIALLEGIRGKGVGKATMLVLLRLSNELNVEIVEAGTMKANGPMRALAASLGLEETDEIKRIPDRGVVAEVLFKNIDKAKWKDLDMKVDFMGPAPE